MLTGLTGMFIIIGRIRTKSKTSARYFYQSVRKTIQRKELMTFASVQSRVHDVQPMLSPLSAVERAA
jgi:hypothetical protein